MKMCVLFNACESNQAEISEFLKLTLDHIMLIQEVTVSIFSVKRSFCFRNCNRAVCTIGPGPHREALRFELCRLGFSHGNISIYVLDENIGCFKISCCFGRFDRLRCAVLDGQMQDLNVAFSLCTERF